MLSFQEYSMRIAGMNFKSFSITGIARINRFGVSSLSQMTVRQV